MYDERIRVSIRFLTYFLLALLSGAEKINFEKMKLTIDEVFYLNQRISELDDGREIGEAEC
jgi:hypothetical protein